MRDLIVCRDLPISAMTFDRMPIDSRIPHGLTAPP